MKRTIITATLALSGLAMTSCSKFLKENSDANVPKEEFYSSLGDAYAVKAGLYSLMQDITEHSYVWGEVRGDLLAEGEGLMSNPDLMAIHNFDDIKTNNRYVQLTKYYKLIQQSNEALLYFKHMGETVPEMKADGGDLVHQLQSEAVTLRAKCYFDMIRTFGDVPFSLSPINDSGDLNEIPPVMGVEAILDQLEYELKWATNYVFNSMTDVRVDDLTNASSLQTVVDNQGAERAIEGGEILRMVYRWNDALGKDWNRTTVNMPYARALLADIYLFREKYELAVAELELIETDGANNDVQISRRAVDYEWFNFIEPTSSSDPRSAGSATSGTSNGNSGVGTSWLQRLFTNNNSSSKADCELVFYLKYGDNYRQNNFFGEYFAPQQVGGSYYFKPSDASIAQYEGELTRGENMSYKIDTLESGIYPVVWKFVADPSGLAYRTNDDQGGRFYSDVAYNYKRVMDCFLKRAEAYNRMGKKAEAIDMLNSFVRKRVGASKAAITNTASLEEIEDVIMNERVKELGYEGERWFDLVRVAKRRGSDYLANRVAERIEDPVQREEVRSKLMNPSNWYLPKGSVSELVIPLQ